MEGTTLEGETGGGAAGPGPSHRERLGAWLYTGAPGRMVNFSIDLGLSLTALGIYGARRAWQRLRSDPRS